MVKGVGFLQVHVVLTILCERHMFNARVVYFFIFYFFELTYFFCLTLGPQLNTERSREHSTF